VTVIYLPDDSSDDEPEPEKVDTSRTWTFRELYFSPQKVSTPRMHLFRFLAPSRLISRANVYFPHSKSGCLKDASPETVKKWLKTDLLNRKWPFIWEKWRTINKGGGAERRTLCCMQALQSVGKRCNRSKKVQPVNNEQVKQNRGVHNDLCVETCDWRRSVSFFLHARREIPGSWNLKKRQSTLKSIENSLILVADT
jgi:hypothetical protein